MPVYPINQIFNFIIVFKNNYVILNNIVKAEKLLEHRQLFKTNDEKIVIIEMDLFKINDKKQFEHLPDGYKFSWIAYLDSDRDVRILFDSHPPKGPHYHIDSDKEGVPFKWTGLSDMRRLFLDMIEKRFGPLIELDEGRAE